MKPSSVAAASSVLSLLLTTLTTLTEGLPISSNKVSIIDWPTNGTNSSAPDNTGSIGTIDTRDNQSDLTFASHDVVGTLADRPNDGHPSANLASLFDDLAGRNTSAIVDIKSGGETIASVLYDESKNPGLLQALEKGSLLAARDAASPEAKDAVPSPQSDLSDPMFEEILRQLAGVRKEQKEQAETANQNTRLAAGGLYAVAGACGLIFIVLNYATFERALSKVKRHVVDWSGCFGRRQEDSHPDGSMGQELRGMQAGNRWTPV